MGAINNLPAIFAASAAFLTGLYGYINNLPNVRVYENMCLFLIVFYIIGILVKRTIKMIWDEQDKKAALAAEAEAAAVAETEAEAAAHADADANADADADAEVGAGAGLIAGAGAGAGAGAAEAAEAMAVAEAISAEPTDTVAAAGLPDGAGAAFDDPAFAGNNG